MIKASKQFIYICFLGIGLTACGIRKPNNTPSKPIEVLAQHREAQEQAVLAQNQSWTALKVRIDGELRRGDKSFSARIQLQASRGKGIRLSVHYLLFEVARVWFTPSGVTFVDLINGGYAQEPYSQFGERLGITIDYPQIESLILGGVFAPGKGATAEDIRNLKYAYIQGQGGQFLGKVLGYNYFFLLNPEASLRKLVVTDNSNTSVFETEYRSEAIGTLPMLQAPAIAEYRIYSSNKKATPQPKGTLLLEWQSVQHLSDDSELSLQPIIKAKYERIDLGKLLNALK